jgi:alkylation response protein AidB-like acyl-CoA dehydrogenase
MDARRPDILGPDAAPLPAVAEPVLALLGERAEAADAHGVLRSSIDALAQAGLLGRALEPVALQRELAERIAMVDATTWFCWTQHQSPMRTLAEAVATADAPDVGQLQAQWLAGLESGELLGAVAFAHVRRPGEPNPVAVRAPGGWRITGTLDWVTSWDIADVVMVMVRGAGPDAGSFITFYLPAGRSVAAGAELPEGVRIEEPLRLLAMSGTHTRPVVFQDVFIPESLVGSVQPVAEWMRSYARKTAHPNPAAFGLIRGAIAELHDVGSARNDDVILALARELAEETRELRRSAYALMDDPQTDPARLTPLRAHSLDLAVRSATAVVIARSGAAMMLGCSAERRLREAMFLQVQAQTVTSRHASLERLHAG